MQRHGALAPRTLESTIYGSFDTFAGSGVAAPDALPTGKVYTGPNVASNTDMGVTVTVTQRGAVTGAYVFSFAGTAANGFAAGSVYHVIISYAISSTNYRHQYEAPIA